MCSDVFIFENSQSDEAYVLAILKGDNIDEQPESSFTLDVLSFIEIDVREFPEPEPILTKSVKGKFDSDFPSGAATTAEFLNCPQYSLQVYEETRLQIKAQCEG